MNGAMATRVRDWRDESGQVVILLAVSLTVILGFIGLATDVGVLIHDKRNLQIAADAAAIAGAKQLTSNPTGVVAAGLAASATNGMTNGQNGIVVTINDPPASGPNINAAGFVEAIVQQTQPTFFMRVLGINSSLVAARAVATNGSGTGTACLITLNQSAPDTIHMQGSFNFDSPGCAIIDDSTDPNALYFNGQGGTLTAGSVGVAGGAGGQVSDSNPAPQQISGVSDPLAGQLTPPSYSSCSAQPSGTSWSPGCYSGTIKISPNQTVTLAPGTYIFTGTLDLSGGGALSGTNVTLYFAAPNGTFGGNGSGNTTLSLSAPTASYCATASTSCYQGILIYEDPLDSNPITLNGTPVSTFQGIIYAPSAQMVFSGNSGTKSGTIFNLDTDLIVNSLYDKGNATVNITNYTKNIGGSPLSTVALVE